MRRLDAALLWLWVAVSATSCGGPADARENASAGEARDGLWSKSGPPLEDGPVIECEALTPPTTRVGAARVRFAEIAPGCGQASCTRLALSVDSYDFLALVRKELRRVPGCERCEVRDVTSVETRDIVIRIRYRRGDEPARLFGWVDDRDQIGHAGPYTLVSARFVYVSPAERNWLNGELDFRCDDGRVAEECRSLRSVPLYESLGPVEDGADAEQR